MNNKQKQDFEAFAGGIFLGICLFAPPVIHYTVGFSKFFSAITTFLGA